MTQRTTLRLIPALLGMAFAGTTQASGFQLLEQNASGIGNAYAGSAAVAENASTIFYNPAGMTQLQAREFSGGLTAVRPSFKFSNGNSNPNALAPAPISSHVLAGNGGDGGELGIVPNAYLSWQLNPDLYFGLGIGAPFGLMTDYSNGWAGGAQSLKFEIKTLNVNPSIAYRMNDMVSLGFGVNWQKLDAQYVRQVGTADYSAPVPGTPPLASSLARLKLSDDTWGWNAGALFNLSPATKLGVSYRSTMKYTATGSVAVTGPSAGVNGAGSSDTKASIKLPDTFILSATHRLNNTWEILGDIAWTGWSSIPKVDIVRTTNTSLYIPGVAGAAAGSTAQTLDTRFRDTWRVAIGANYQLDAAWKLKGGIAYDQSPVRGPDTRLVSLPDNNRTWFSLGAQWKPNQTATVDVGAAYLYVKDAAIHNDQRTAVGSTNRGLVDGTYKNNAWILGAQYSLAF